MGEVKRYALVRGSFSNMHQTSDGNYVLYNDYARLERERDEAVSVADSMGRDAVEFSAKLAEAQAELTRLRAVEAAAILCEIAEITLHDGKPVVTFDVAPDELATLYPVGTRLCLVAATRSN